MQTPNWGPQNGVPMDQATFDAYVVANPPPGSLADPSREVSGYTPLPRGGDDKLSTEEDPYWYDWYRRQARSQEASDNPYQAGNQDQARAQQMQVIQDLQRQAAGDPNSRAQQQLQQGYEAAQSQQSSLGSTMRGQSAGAAMRGVQAGQQGIQRGLAGDQQMLMAQEQQASQAMMAQLLAQQQGQDITQATGMAQGAQGAQGLDDALRQFYLGGMSGMDLAATQRENDIARAKIGFQEDQTKLTQGLINAGAGATASVLGTVGSFNKPKTPAENPNG